MAKSKWSKVILIGDSLTQRAFDVDDGCWGSMLAHNLQRISDVVGRGFSGYTSRSVRTILPELLSKDQYERAACVVILLGSNDCADNSSIQHVPKDQTAENLKFIVDYIKACGVSTDKFVLMTPPCYYHEDFAKAQGKPIPMRTPDEYSEVARKVAEELKLECLDLNDITKKHSNSRNLFSDGLHFNLLGAKVVFDSLWPLVVKRVTAYHGSFEPNFPPWDKIL